MLSINLKQSTKTKYFKEALIVKWGQFCAFDVYFLVFTCLVFYLENVIP